ncbi:DNA helicase RecQ [Patescibacteria group bacterium]|nr:DNA helicase RecQ [Patescibacteria group bacterium]
MDYEKQIDMELARQALQKYFGYTSFLPLQKDIIKDVLQKNDVFVLMPTGGGKSLCYQIPSLLLDGITIVVSPLIALMKDQVDGLKANGISAAYINSSLRSEQIKQIKSELLENKISILYVAPERIVLPDFISFLQSLNINLIAIDEAHCISEWGHDFRPEYRQLKLIKEHLPKIPLIAMTATAISEVQEDIVTQLKLENPKCYRASLNRSNLFYQVKPKDTAYQQLLHYLKDHNKDSGIIYCQSRKDTDNLANKLQSDGYRVLPYHAGLSSNLRTETQERFVKDDVEIIVATIAFGMGIDKSNIRFVIHYDLPKNLESYYQETGRAGRDGEKSDCILFYSYGDKRKIDYFIDQKDNVTEKRIASQKLSDMIKFCESITCRRKILLNYFGEDYNETNCNGCDICLEPKETIDGTIIAQKIMSCTTQLNERFGMGYIADVLCGSRNKKIISNRHDALTSHGTGKEYSKKQWQIYLRELIQLDYLKLEGEYPIVKIIPKLRDDLSKHKEISLTRPVDDVKITQIDYNIKMDSDLFEILRVLRKEIAVAEGMPPYIIFNDLSLRAMATRLPRDRSDFLNINGVGENKLEKYSEKFLEKIDAYCKEHKIEASKEHSTEPMHIHKNRQSVNTKTSTFQETIQLCKQNLSIEEIAQTRKLAPSTIASQIEKLINSGEDISIDSFVANDKQEQIRKVLSLLGDGLLKPIKEELGDDYSYEEIRLVRAYEMQKSSNKPEYIEKWYDGNLFSKLVGLRNKVSEQCDVPSGEIFDDDCLKEMARLYPQSTSNFEKTKGIGNKKNENFGEAFLKEITEYCVEHNIDDKTPVDPTSKQSLEKSKSYSIDDIRNTHPNAYNPWTSEEENMLISEYRKGKTIEELMVILGRQRGGITSMLRKLNLR